MSEMKEREQFVKDFEEQVAELLRGNWGGYFVGEAAEALRTAGKIGYDAGKLASQSSTLARLTSEIEREIKLYEESSDKQGIGPLVDRNCAITLRNLRAWIDREFGRESIREGELPR